MIALLTRTMGGGTILLMTKSEHIFWGIALIAGLYLLMGPGVSSLSRVNAQLANGNNAAAPAPAAQQAAPAGGHYMPDGTWMAGSMGGGCGMGAGGGGCGCGGGR